MKQIDLEITTLQKARHSKTGMQGGERGAVTQSSTEVAAWLASKAPADMDRAAVSRASSHGVTLGVKYEGRYPTGPNGECLPSYEVAASCEIHGTDAQRQAAKRDVEKFLTPAPVRAIEAWLAELSVITAGRGREGFDAELMVTAYAARLAQFPADVVREALLGRAWKWFPTWAELEVICKAKASPRRHMLAALSQPEPDHEPQRRQPTAEERERIAALVAEQFPHAPRKWGNRAVAEVTSGDCMKEAGA